MTEPPGSTEPAGSALRGYSASALYIHVPYCAAKCAYCDFNSQGPAPGSRHSVARMATYARAVAREVHERARLGAAGGARLASCYIGGGTPTVLPEADLAAIVEAVHSAFGLAPGCEFTLEANPGTVDACRLDRLIALGINRLSFGVQSLHDSELRVLGRIHSASEARDAVGAARQSGFSNISLDLMYGLPRQTMRDWRRTLAGVVELSPEHISAYCLKLEEGTPLLTAVQNGHIPRPDEDLAADMMEAATQDLAEAGYLHYEISNYARPGYESRHNLVYWRYEPYLGVGAGATGFSGSERYTNERDDLLYAQSVCAVGLPLSEVEALSVRERMAEASFMNLRLLEGLDTRVWSEKFSVPFLQVYGEEVCDLIASGLLEWSGPTALRLSHRGVMLGNLVFERFLR